MPASGAGGEDARTGGGDLFHIMPLQEVAGGKLGGELVGKLPVSFGVFSEGGENDVAGKQAVRGGVAGADGFALGCARAGGNSRHDGSGAAREGFAAERIE